MVYEPILTSCGVVDLVRRKGIFAPPCVDQAVAGFQIRTDGPQIPIHDKELFARPVRIPVVLRPVAGQAPYMPAPENRPAGIVHRDERIAPLTVRVHRKTVVRKRESCNDLVVLPQQPGGCRSVFIARLDSQIGVIAAAGRAIRGNIERNLIAGADMAVRRSVIQAVVDENPVVDLIFAPDNKLQIMPRVSADIEIRRVIFTRINDVFDKGFVRAPFRENPQVGGTGRSIFRALVLLVGDRVYRALQVLEKIRCTRGSPFIVDRHRFAVIVIRLDRRGNTARIEGTYRLRQIAELHRAKTERRCDGVGDLDGIGDLRRTARYAKR